MNNEDREDDIDPEMIKIAEELSKKYMDESQELAKRFHEEAEKKGLSPVQIAGSLFINHASIAGSLIVSSIIANINAEKVEKITTNQVLAFLNFYQKQLCDISQEVFFEGLEKRAGINFKQLVGEDAHDSLTASSFKTSGGFNDDGNPGGMIH